MLNILSVSPSISVDKIFPMSQTLEGKVSRTTVEFTEMECIRSHTAIVTGDWISWKYMDDYMSSIFGVLEYHPSIYHHILKTYPFLMDRSKPWNGIILGKTRPEPRILNEFAKRSRRTILFTDLPDLNLSEFTQDVFVLSQEPFHVVSYFAGLVGELLIDSEISSWWSGMHATYRERNVYYIPSDEVGPHYYHPRWMDITEIIE